jgi:hypothetical protein
MTFGSLATSRPGPVPFRSSSLQLTYMIDHDDEFFCSFKNTTTESAPCHASRFIFNRSNKVVHQFYVQIVFLILAFGQFSSFCLAIAQRTSNARKGVSNFVHASVGSLAGSLASEFAELENGAGIRLCRRPRLFFFVIEPGSFDDAYQNECSRFSFFVLL